MGMHCSIYTQNRNENPILDNLFFEESGEWERYGYAFLEKSEERVRNGHAFLKASRGMGKKPDLSMRESRKE